MSKATATNTVPLSKRAQIARRVLLGICLFVGLTAVPCGILIAIYPDGKPYGMDAILPHMQSWPLANIFFRDLFWSGVALTLVNGWPNIIASVMLLRYQRWCYIAGLICGCLLFVWIGWEMLTIPNWLSGFYWVLAILQIACGIICLRSQKQATTAASAIEDVS
jgi:hypothetical protein